ncbi:hypothetical protein [Mycobacterium sp.]|uniref:hypothetical protein n=1 Tax=Mycobacterium sp. TaxID=1785 RepID=UPI003BAB8471
MTCDPRSIGQITLFGRSARYRGGFDTKLLDAVPGCVGVRLAAFSADSPQFQQVGHTMRGGR